MTDAKKRSVWSLERITDLVTSPIYTGCFSEHRRWRSGRMIIRDSFYWLPLIQLTVGPRPEEAAALRRTRCRFATGSFALYSRCGPMRARRHPEANGYVPIPNILLRLGFAEWWRAQLALPGDLLFPELPASETDGKVSDLFGKRRGRIFEHIGDPGSTRGLLRWSHDGRDRASSPSARRIMSASPFSGTSTAL